MVRVPSLPVWSVRVFETHLASIASCSFVLLCAAGAGASPRTHDGFQFRGAVGGGYLADGFTIPGAAISLVGPVGVGSTDVMFHGPAGAFEAYFGGTPAPGLVFGGFLTAMSTIGPKVVVNGAEIGQNSDVTLNFGMLGPYVNYYPDPGQGFHLLGMLAVAQTNVNDGTTKYNSATGFGLGAGVGYDWWVGDEWSLGILGRFSWATMRSDQGEVSLTHAAVAPSLLFSFQYQ
jgi:hypothetical protein